MKTVGITEIVAIGDIHGRTVWKEIVAKEKDVDKIIFMGDYFDTFLPISYEKQVENFQKIIEFKKENKSKVVLLMGNHDFHYLEFAGEIYSGFQSKGSAVINMVVEEALSQGLLQACFLWGKYLFTHAGVTATWCNLYYVDIENIESSINNLFKNCPSAFRFLYGSNMSSYGDDICQSPFWVRPKSLIQNGIENNYIQVVGHTQQKEITKSCDYWFIDVLDKVNQYFKISGKKVKRMSLDDDKVF